LDQIDQIIGSTITPVSISPHYGDENVGPLIKRNERQKQRGHERQYKSQSRRKEG
jgi:hypothetical protein